MSAGPHATLIAITISAIKTNFLSFVAAYYSSAPTKPTMLFNSHKEIITVCRYEGRKWNTIFSHIKSMITIQIFRIMMEYCSVLLSVVLLVLNVIENFEAESINECLTNSQIKTWHIFSNWHLINNSSTRRRRRNFIWNLCTLRFFSSYITYYLAHT